MDFSLDVPVIGREKEITFISSFLNASSSTNKGLSLYVSGCPGTGKTLCVRKAVTLWMRSLGKTKSPHIVYVNAMNFRDPLDVLLSITNESDQKRQFKKRRSADFGEFSARLLDSMKHVIDSLSKHKRVLIIIDELDQLCPSMALTKNKKKRPKSELEELELLNVLLQISSGTYSSCITLIGIANSLSLSISISKYGHSFSKSIIFPPYTSDQLKDILKAQGGKNSSTPSVNLEICSRRIAAFHGDCRKAMDIITQSSSTTSELISTLNTCSGSIFDSEDKLKCLPLRHLIVLTAIYLLTTTLVHHDDQQYTIADIRRSVKALSEELHLPASASSINSSIQESLEALHQCGLVKKQQVSRKQVQSSWSSFLWRISTPPESLKETLIRVNPALQESMKRIIERARGKG